MFKIVPYNKSNPEASLGTVYDDVSDSIDAMREFETKSEKFYFYNMLPIWNNIQSSNRFIIGFHVSVMSEHGEFVGVLCQTKD